MGTDNGGAIFDIGYIQYFAERKNCFCGFCESLHHCYVLGPVVAFPDGDSKTGGNYGVSFFNTDA